MHNYEENEANECEFRVEVVEDRDEIFGGHGGDYGDIDDECHLDH